MVLIILLIACLLSAILYRMGGASGYNTKFRDWGCSLVLIALSMILFGVGQWWLYLITFILSWGALSTYWDFLFGYDNFYFHGFMCGLAAIPLIWAGAPLFLVLERIVICTVGMGIWSNIIDNDVMEELGRGVFYII